MQTLYLNNSGTRWKVSGDTIRVIGAGYNKIRVVDYYSSFGNFATVSVRVNGKRYTGFATESDIPGDTLPVLQLDKCRVG